MIERYIRDVPDFPKEGIVFKDITPLLASPEGFAETIAALNKVVDPADYDVICGIESRGFIFGAAMALALGKSFVPVRKPGKLPWETASESYELEYGTDSIEIHTDAFQAGKGRVLMVDDLLATGGTMGAALSLVRKVGGEPIACAFVIELGFLPGREKLGNISVHSLVMV